MSRRIILRVFPLPCRARRTIRPIGPILRWLMAGSLLAVWRTQADRANEEFFENRIRPVLVEHCYECHSQRATKLKGGLRLDDRPALLQGGDSGPAVVPGDPERSLLWRAVARTDPHVSMPPARDGQPPLPAETVADLAHWIRQGALFPDSATPTSNSDSPKAVAQSHWAFQAVQNPPLPAVQNSTWPQTSVDAFILADLEAHQSSPAAPADRRTWLRRATFDLTGLPPTPEDMRAFLADESSAARARVLDRLLDSPHYGERAARHWLDVVRYADTAGETADYPIPDAWRYRNYVIDSFNRDKPFDEFLREQIAGDILARQGPRERYAERITATGYLAVSRRFGFDSENYHHLTLQDTIDTLGQSVLGLSLGCARCHNHKFDPIPATDYYALYGIFESTRYAFPGSEQKQKRRALVPLVPPEEAQERWRQYDQELAQRIELLRQEKQSAPSVILRSLDELDGDFELQAPAAGGSKGVLVPPWVYDGLLEVTTAAQSPFQQAYLRGAVGVEVPAGTSSYRLSQALPRGQGHDSDTELYVNLEFRVLASDQQSSTPHRFWIGSSAASPLLEVFLSNRSIVLRSGTQTKTLQDSTNSGWQNLQLHLDRRQRLVSGFLGNEAQSVAFSDIPLPDQPVGPTQLGLDAESSATPRSGLHLDHVAVQTTPFPPTSTKPLLPFPMAEQSQLTAFNEQLKAVVGLDGDFELQSDGTPPGPPWGPGPKSVVQIQSDAQSPFQNLYPAGSLGIHLPGGSAYNGFGQTLPRAWKTNDATVLYASFDVRTRPAASERDGSWRYYLGHGPGSSAALELFFTGQEFFRRDADQHPSVQALQPDTWYQVQLRLDLIARTYSGSLSSATQSTPFAGAFAPNWDGTIDYTFIDSYGHLPGAKPTLDADNFVLRTNSLPILTQVALAPATTTDRREQARELRKKIQQRQHQLDTARRDLERMLAEGPVELAYGAVEGTPRNARFQFRGEPEKLGDEVPRGFLQALGGGPLPPGTVGSGRLELAEWLTHPKHPLTARVMVNRIWQQHFGTGLVKTPNDFGTRGQRPTHPELLDHLASRFVASGWSVKAMHRLILLSATYQQSSIPSVTNSTLREYSFFPRRRLSAEEIRDAILAVSGELDASPGKNHPFPSPVTWGYSQHAPFSAVYDHNHRSVYLMTQRLKRHPFLALFDGADPNMSTAERRTSTVPTQSLYFLNDPFVHEKANRLSARLVGLDLPERNQVDQVYWQTLSRPATPEESAEAEAFLNAYRQALARTNPEVPPSAPLAALTRVIFGDNEFLHID